VQAFARLMPMNEMSMSRRARGRRAGSSVREIDIFTGSMLRRRRDAGGAGPECMARRCHHEIAGFAYRHEVSAPCRMRHRDRPPASICALNFGPPSRWTRARCRSAPRSAACPLVSIASSGAIVSRPGNTSPQTLRSADTDTARSPVVEITPWRAPRRRVRELTERRRGS